MLLLIVTDEHRLPIWELQMKDGRVFLVKSCLLFFIVVGIDIINAIRLDLFERILLVELELVETLIFAKGILELRQRISRNMSENKKGTMHKNYLP